MLHGYPLVSFRVLLVTLCAFFASTASAQVSITKADMPVAGDTLRYTVGNANGVTLPATGNNISWDYSQISPLYQGVASYKLAKDVNPAFLVFGTQAYGNLVADTVKLGGITLTNDYFFYRLNNQTFSTVGQGVVVNGVPIPAVYSDVDEDVTFPLNYNDKDSTTFRVKFSIPGVGSILEKGTRTNNVQGQGSITTPYGTFAALMVKVTVRQIDSVFSTLYPQGVGTKTTTTHYIWLANGTKYPVLDLTIGKNLQGATVVLAAKYRDQYRNLVTTAPKPDFYASKTTAAPGDSILFLNVTPPSQAATAYAWTVQPSAGVTYVKGTSATSKNPYIKFANVGTYTVQLKATAGGLTGDTIKPNYITVAIPTAPKPNFTATKQNLNLGDSVTLTNLTQYVKGVTYKWTLTPSTGFSYLNNTKDTSRNPKLRFTIAGSYTVKLAATIGTSTRDTTKTNYFTVSVVQAPLRPDFVATRTNPYTGDTIQLQNLTQTGTDTVKYQWTITPIGSVTYVKGTSNTSISPWITFSQMGAYTIKLRATRGLAFKDTVKSNYINVTDAPPPSADFYCPNQNLNTGDTAKVTNQSTQAPGLRYTWTITPASGWNLVGGTSISSRDLMVVFTAPGSYGLKLENLLNSGSTVNDRPDFFTVSVPVATKALTNRKAISAYPNPATSSVSLAGLQSPSSAWAWVDALGHATPVSAQMEDAALVVQTEGLSNGLYILKGQDNGVPVMLRIQVQR